MLTGDLSDFSLREMLQFLATTSSSGVLELRNVESRACIAFRDGGICLALLDMEGIDGLAARMIRAGGVDMSQLRVSGADHDGDAVDLAGVLAARTAGHARAAEVFREHTYETLGWLTRREEAEFLFRRSAQLDGWPFDVVDLADALDAVDDRSAAWDELADIISDLTRVCSPVPDVSDVEEISLTNEQWRVLSLVDGRRKLKDLIELSGIGHLATCRQLQHLVAAGMVELVAADASSSLDDMLAELDALRPHGAGTASTPRHSAPTAVDRGFARPSTEEPVVPVPAHQVPDDGAHRPPAVQALVTAPAAPAGPDPDAVAAVVGTVDDEGLDSDANRALFDRLMGGGGTGS